jgi:hypothetical protein
MLRILLGVLLSTVSVAALASVSSKKVVIFGATGYIGKYVVKESVRRGFDTVAVVREGSKVRDDYLGGARIVYSDVTNSEALSRDVFNGPADVVVSCLASRSGVKKDAYKIDYEATLNCLTAARKAKAGQFILLSAYCVKKPLLQFQHAKLKFEDALTSAGDIKYRYGTTSQLLVHLRRVVLVLLQHSAAHGLLQERVWPAGAPSAGLALRHVRRRQDLPVQPHRRAGPGHIHDQLH